MNLIFFDDVSWTNLLPLTFTKPVAELRVGILKISEKWERRLSMKGSFLTQEYLLPKFPTDISNDNLLINGSLLPDDQLTETIGNLSEDQALRKGQTLLALKTKQPDISLNDHHIIENAIEYKSPVSMVDYPWKIFALNGQEIAEDYRLVTSGRDSVPLSKTVRTMDSANIFAEEGFRGEYFTVNASAGPVYLGKDSEIMEGAVIRGPFALCENATVKLSAKIYGPTTIGPYCKAGGEINNSILQSYSNKGHDGFLGNSVIGEWCNLGADTNNSNLKNNYTEVRIWNYLKEGFIKTGMQFCGLTMGDHSKSGINTMFNTGTVAGVSANIFGAGFPRNFIPSFTWGGHSKTSVYSLAKAFETMELVMARREISLTETDMAIYRHIFDITSKYRH